MENQNSGGASPERKSTAPYRYFTEEEFKKLTPSCSLSDMDVDFMRRLDYARHIAGFPFVLNCAYRSPAWEKMKGRVNKDGEATSFHTKGLAVDIRCTDGKQRARLIWSLWYAGIPGIGVYKSFIHADGRKEPCVFYGE